MMRNMGATEPPPKIRFFKLRLLLEQLGFSPWGKYYHCSKCGHFFEKSSVKISGYDAQDSLRHVHCPKCGSYVSV
jgi:DNA-directed RNA polymerase subunit RPC12/RpoP